VRVPIVPIPPLYASDPAPRSAEFECELQALGIILLLRKRIFARSNHWVRMVLPSGAAACFLPPEAFLVPLVETARVILCDLTGPGLAYDATVAGERICDAAWRLLLPAPRFRSLKDYVGVDPARLDCVLAEGFGVSGQGGLARTC